MKLISILLALLIVGFLAYKQVGPDSDSRMQEMQRVSNPNAPRVPVNPNEVKQFGVQMNDYMNEEAAKRAESIDAMVAQ